MENRKIAPSSSSGLAWNCQTGSPESSGLEPRLRSYAVMMVVIFLTGPWRRECNYAASAKSLRYKTMRGRMKMARIFEGCFHALRRAPFFSHWSLVLKPICCWKQQADQMYKHVQTNVTRVTGRWSGANFELISNSCRVIGVTSFGTEKQLVGWRCTRN